MRLNSLPRFFRFALVGCAGYCVDVAALYFAIYGLGAGLYWGRIFSYLCASSSTWYMNRLITFADLRSDKFAGEWLKFVVLNGVGGVVNYTTVSHSRVSHSRRRRLSPWLWDRSVVSASITFFRANLCFLARRRSVRGCDDDWRGHDAAGSLAMLGFFCLINFQTE